jgi:hypothetical protein
MPGHIKHLVVLGSSMLALGLALLVATPSRVRPGGGANAGRRGSTLLPAFAAVSSQVALNDFLDPARHLYDLTGTARSVVYTY